MADADGKAAKELIRDVDKQLAAKKECPHKDLLVKFLKQAASALPKLRTQSDLLKPAIKPLSDSILKHGVLQQKDKDVRLLVSICVCEILRILAPNPGFSDADLRGIFQLLLDLVGELADTKIPYYSRRVQLLETMAKFNFCVIMLDIGCEDLIQKMFSIFFGVIRPHLRCAYNIRPRLLFPTSLTIGTLPPFSLKIRPLTRELEGQELRQASFAGSLLEIQHHYRGIKELLWSLRNHEPVPDQTPEASSA